MMSETEKDLPGKSMRRGKEMEIERKFRMRALPEGWEKYPSVLIEQAYVCREPVIRVRKRDDKSILTVKGEGMLAREEFELPLSKEQFEKLWDKVETGTIDKKRYIIPLDDVHTAELDIYGGTLDGFMNVEVEFSSLKDAVLFDAPSWFGAEVTEDRRYSNASLVKYGIPVK